jgi:3-phenylpropionate/trans-cinnamate dioxygenase ferredoxin subunit
VNGFADVGPVQAFAVGELTRVDIPGKDIFVLRAPGEKFFAVKNTCPHQGGPLCLGKVDGTWVPSAPGEYEWGLEYQVIRCPYHTYEYDLESGRPLAVPGVDRVIRYDVEVDDGRVLVSLKGKR